LRRGDFKRDGKGVAGNLFRQFEKSALELAGKNGNSAPFRMILSLAIDLHNESNASGEALILIDAIEAFAEVPKDADLVEELRKSALGARPSNSLDGGAAA
jgi:hypothetical protein